MSKLLIDPLGDAIMLAISEADEVKAQVEAGEGDAALAISEAFKRLPPLAFDEVVLVNGPGNFTRLRVGLGFARGMAMGKNIPSRGIGVFDIDYALIPDAPLSASLYRDARGGRYYEARFTQGQIDEIVITKNLPKTGYSAEALADLTSITHDPKARIKALARISESSIGQSPAKANYVRPPDAALPKEPPLVILDG